MINSVFLAPHNDDEALFGAYTLLRERPLVVIVTDSYIQWNRGDRITADTRRQETIRAMEILKCPVVFLGIKDTELSRDNFRERIKHFEGFGKIYAPAIQGGNPQHDIVGLVSYDLFGPKVTQYTTYTKTELWTKGSKEIIPTEEEKELKNKALWCYQSQINLPSTRPHFEAVIDKSEWLNE